MSHLQTFPSRDCHYQDIRLWDKVYYHQCWMVYESCMPFGALFASCSFDWAVVRAYYIRWIRQLYWTYLNRHQTILHTFSQLFLNLTLSGVPHLYIQLPNGQYLSDLCKMCNLEANQRKMWTGDHRILTYIFKWERLNTAGHSHTVSIGHWVVPLYND